MEPSQEILERAHAAGFDLAGVAPLHPPPDAERFEAWLDAGRHAGMEWLARQRARIVDPRRVAPEARSLLIVGLGHARAPVDLPEGGRIARYAAGRDYHNRMTKRLRSLGREFARDGLARPLRTVVDAGPLLERSHAAEAGLGFPSKAANLLHPRLGPFFFLGELLLDVELEPTGPPPAGSCGTCTACLDACPTGALPAPGVLDARLCLSYHTIENRGAVPHELRRPLGELAFGCDVCSEVCPWTKDAPDASERWGTHPFVAERRLVDWLRLEKGELPEAARGSPLQRPRREGLARNAALVLGNTPREEGREALEHALEHDPDPRVRAAAFWGLVEGHAGDHGVAGALERSLAREPDPEARVDMQRSRDAAGG